MLANKMKRLHPRGSRLNNHAKDRPSNLTQHNTDCGDCSISPGSLSRARSSSDSRQNDAVCNKHLLDCDSECCDRSEALETSASEEPRTPKRGDRTSFFRTLIKKLSSNMHRKRDSSVSDDECQVDKQHSDHPGSTRDRVGRRSHRKRNDHTVNRMSKSIDALENVHTSEPYPFESDGNTQSQKNHRGIKTQSTNNLFSPDTEYGHASAPITPVHSASVASRTNASRLDHSNFDAACCHTLPRDMHLVHIGRDQPLASHAQSQNGSSDALSSNEAKLLHDRLDHNAQQMSDSALQLFPNQPVYDQVKDTEYPKTWSLTKELFKLSKHGWYWGPITRVEAEQKLTGQADGAFLVRDSSDDRYLLSLSFRSYGRTLHTRIEHCNGIFSFYAQPESEGYTSIVDLIEHSMTDSQTGVFCYSRARLPGAPSFPVRLTKPVSRFSQVRTLQYSCRFVIRQYIRLDHIQKLPLPTSIKGWLEENQY